MRTTQDFKEAAQLRQAKNQMLHEGMLPEAQIQRIPKLSKTDSSLASATTTTDDDADEGIPPVVLGRTERRQHSIRPGLEVPSYNKKP